MTDRELMQQALDSLEGYARNCRCEGSGGLCDAGKALRARLAQEEPEPEKSQDKPCAEDDGCPTEKAVLQRFWREHQAQPEPEELAALEEAMIEAWKPIPQREFIGLTDDEIKEIIGPWGGTPIKGYTRELIDKIEAKLKEKNNG